METKAAVGTGGTTAKKGISGIRVIPLAKLKQFGQIPRSSDHLAVLAESLLQPAILQVVDGAEVAEVSECDIGLGKLADVYGPVLLGDLWDHDVES